MKTPQKRQPIYGDVKTARDRVGKPKAKESMHFAIKNKMKKC